MPDERPEIGFDEATLRAFYGGKRVLITGAAGSVGVALAERLSKLGCESLALLDHFDHGLIDISERVRRMASATEVVDVLCDVRDTARLEIWMRRCRPDIVIHGAALKHVHFGERHPVECLLTNLVGVRNVAMAADEVGASRFVLISTDKAAQPSCLMGATKRLAELFLLGCERDEAMRMRSRAVRFGNVLGSQGSVLPRFQAQIRAGGPLEVTHPEMERFFMSPEEAVGFILMTAAAPDFDAAPGATCYLELGAPVSILKMGKNLIRKSGKPIDIKFVGLRPGEKLSEQLYDEFEVVEATALEHVFQVRPKSEDACLSLADIAHFETMARSAEDAVVRQRVFDFLDERLGRRRKAAG